MDQQAYHAFGGGSPSEGDDDGEDGGAGGRETETSASAARQRWRGGCPKFGVLQSTPLRAREARRSTLCSSSFVVCLEGSQGRYILEYFIPRRSSPYQMFEISFSLNHFSIPLDLHPRVHVFYFPSSSFLPPLLFLFFPSSTSRHLPPATPPRLHLALLPRRRHLPVGSGGLGRLRRRRPPQPNTNLFAPYSPVSGARLRRRCSPPPPPPPIQGQSSLAQEIPARHLPRGRRRRGLTATQHLRLLVLLPKVSD